MRLARVFRGMAGPALLAVALTVAGEGAGVEPLGTAGATPSPDERYVFDMTGHTPEQVAALLARAEQLGGAGAATGPRIAFVLHGDDLELFALRSRDRYGALADRAERLDREGVIDFKACRITARQLGLPPDGLPPFIELVPNGPKEIERLRASGYTEL